MIITNSYKCIMGTRRDAFHRAFRFFLENTKGVTQDKVSKKTGIKQGMISGMKTGKRYGTEDGRRLVAEYFGKTYDEFVDVGEALLEAERKATLSVSTPPISCRANPSNLESIDHLHWKVVEQFDQKDKALRINQALVELEKLDPGQMDDMLEIVLDRLYRKQREAAEKRDAANDGRE